jgi:tetratricopeptide (TPR) repeat protein
VLTGRSGAFAFDVELLREQRRNAIRIVLEAIGSPAPPSSSIRVDGPAALVAEAHPTAFGPLARAFASEGQPLRAAHNAYRGARLALEAGDLDAAERFLDMADQHLATPAGAVVPALFSGLVDVTRAQVTRWRGKHDEASRLARRALARLPAGGVPWCEAIGERATAAGKLGDKSEVLAVSAALRASKPPAEAPYAWDRACSRAVVQLFYLGEPKEARALLRWFVRHTTPERRSLSPGALVTAALFDGRLDDHLHALRDAVTAFTRAGDLRSAVLYQSSVGYVWGMLGEWSHATRTLTAALALATRVGLPTLIALVQHNLGWAFAHVRHGADAAMNVETAAIDALRAQRDRRFLAGSLAYRSQMYLRKGDCDRAETDAREALELAGETTAPLVQATLADVLLARGNATEARDLALAAVRAAEAANPPEAGEALASLVLSRALLALGDVREAKRVARAAWSRARKRASRIHDAALRKSFLEKVPEHRALRLLVVGSAR